MRVNRMYYRLDNGWRIRVSHALHGFRAQTSRTEGPLHDEEFPVDGTLIEVWDSPAKSLRLVGRLRHMAECNYHLYNSGLRNSLSAWRLNVPSWN
jgi:hypothetical protein